MHTVDSTVLAVQVDILALAVQVDIPALAVHTVDSPVVDGSLLEGR